MLPPSLPRPLIEPSRLPGGLTPLPPAPGARRREVDLERGHGMRPLFSAWWTYDGKVFYRMWTLDFGGGIPMLASVVRPGG